MIRRTVPFILCILLALWLCAACGQPPAKTAVSGPTDVPTASPTPAVEPVWAAVPSPAPAAASPSPAPSASATEPAETFAPTATPTAVPTASPTPAVEPVITLTGGESLVVNAAFTFEDPGAAARDCFGADLTDRIEVEGKVIPYLVGDYVLTYSVTDDQGRRAEAQRTVTVKPVDLPPTMDPPPKTIYLTFDDGPGPYTAQLLDILKRYDVKATFFVVGKAGEKELIRRAYEEGHSIGVHSYSHIYNEIYASEEAFFADFLAAEEVVKEQTGQYTCIFRFPGGSGNTVSCFNPGIMTRLAKIMEDMGYRYFDWTANSTDATSLDLSILEYFYALRSGLPADGSPMVVLQHDLNGRSVRAVEVFIPWALENGYTFLPLDMTSPVIHTRIRN